MLGVLLLFFSTNTKQLSDNKTYKKEQTHPWNCLTGIAWSQLTRPSRWNTSWSPIRRGRRSRHLGCSKDWDDPTIVWNVDPGFSKYSQQSVLWLGNQWYKEIQQCLIFQSVWSWVLNCRTIELSTYRCGLLIGHWSRVDHEVSELIVVGVQRNRQGVGPQGDHTWLMALEWS